MPGPNGEECGKCSKFEPYNAGATFGGCKAKGSGFKLCESRAAELVTLGVAPSLDAACRSPLAWYAPCVFWFDYCVDEYAP
jgi:hypothetical protein